MVETLNLINGKHENFRCYKMAQQQRLFSVIALLRFMGIILVPNTSEANLANDPANNRWKYGLWYFTVSTKYSNSR